MIFIPFVFFLIILTALLWSRRKFDLASYVALLYVIISFFAILNDFFGLRYPDVVNYEISFEATFVYCVLLGIFLIPIVRYTKNGIMKMTPIENQNILKILSTCAFVLFCVTLVGAFNSLLGVLTGDMKALRSAVYARTADDAWYSTLPFGLKQFVSMGNIFFADFWIMQFLAFFSLFVQKTKKYAVFFFIASLLGPLWGILNIDRSKVTYWIIALIANYFMFDKQMTDKQKKIFVVFSSICILFLIIYLSMMTNARFDGRDYGGTIVGPLAGIIAYLGQPFVHFSFFYDNFQNNEPTLAGIFPFIHSFFFGGFGSGVAIQAHLTSLYHWHFGVFYTFLGHILISAGKAWMFVYVIVLALVGFSLFIQKPHEKETLTKLYLFMTYSSIMYLGVFGYSYSSFFTTVSFVFFLFIFKLMSIRIKQ